MKDTLAEGWSPEQISGRIRIDHPGQTINHEAIYQYIYHLQNPEKGLYDRAIEQYEYAIRLAPSATVYNSLGVLYSDKNMTERAIEYYQAAINLQPHYAIAYNNIGLAYEKIGSFSQAFEYLSIAAKLDPGNHSFLIKLQKITAIKNKLAHD